MAGADELDLYGPARPVTRRRFLRYAGGLGALGGLSYLVARGVFFEEDKASSPGPDPARVGLDRFADNITSGGVPKDGIPAIDEPKFVPASEAGFLSDEDIVFGLAWQGVARAYPQPVMVWHEIVNDRFPDGPLSITYCPLTGSAVAFRGTAPGGEPYTFGTSGDLVNSNLLMYDRQTDSRWPQILGRAIQGPSRGRTLEEIPIDWTTWARWRSAHPDTDVLSTDTGYIRDYGRDPYGSYSPVDGYYEKGSSLYFNVLHQDDRFDKKEVVVGAKLGPTRLAVPKTLVRKGAPAAVTMGQRPVTFLYDPELDEGRAFLAVARKRTLSFASTQEPGFYRDSTTGSAWDVFGRAVDGPLAGTRLERIVSYDVMWFAWVAFFPETNVVG